MKVWLHRRENPSDAWDNSKMDVEFERLPNINECFALNSDELYKVLLVVTNNFPHANDRYEIYAERTKLENLL